MSTASPSATSAPTPQALRLALGSAPPTQLRPTLERVRAALEADRYI